jgi:hypothetical protein
MKIRIRLKSPDAIHDAVYSAAYDEMAEQDGDEFMESNVEGFVSELFAGSLRKWIAYKEYLTVEIDTEEETARVLEQR